MDWALAIRRNHLALLAVVAAIVALLGGREAVAGPITRRLRSAALSLLTPAEAAARRLIVIAARGLAVTVRPAPSFAFAAVPGSIGPGRTGRPPAFKLFDPAKRYTFKLEPAPPAGVPRIRTFWGAPSAPVLLRPVEAPRSAMTPVRTDPDAPVDAARLRLRLATLERALADLPRQARRLARWRARGDTANHASVRPHRALRIGRPPGWRARPDRDVDEVLRDCHELALDALRPDTS